MCSLLYDATSHPYTCENPMGSTSEKEILSLLTPCLHQAWPGLGVQSRGIVVARRSLDPRTIAAVKPLTSTLARSRNFTILGTMHAYVVQRMCHNVLHVTLASEEKVRKVIQKALYSRCSDQCRAGHIYLFARVRPWAISHRTIVALPSYECTNENKNRTQMLERTFFRKKNIYLRSGKPFDEFNFLRKECV